MVSEVKRRRSRRSEGGFTLAGVLVLVSIVMIFVAYTVPKQWAEIMQREGELQTIYVVREYARGCIELQRKQNVWPTALDQVKEARLPRFIRGGPKSEFLDPLTGELDWLIIPAAAAQAGNGTQPGNPNGTISVSGPGGTFGVAGSSPGAGAGGTTTGGTTTSRTAGTSTAAGTRHPPPPPIP